MKRYTKKATPTGVVLGKGTYSSVIEVSSVGGILAAKIFNAFSDVKQLSLVDKLQTQLTMMMQLNHRNIVQCKGLSFVVDQPLPLLLMERMMTSLHAYLLDPKNSNFPVRRKLLILSDTASGLEYLHTHKPIIVHCNITATNVLLDSQLIAKIADIENSRTLDLDASVTPESLTPKSGSLDYLPPKAQGEDYDPSLDVFSFGHLSLFTVIQSPVHPLLPPNYTDSRRKVRTEVKRREQFFEKAEQLLSEQDSLLHLMKQCLHNRPAQRPHSGELVTSLKEMLILAGICMALLLPCLILIIPCYRRQCTRN